MPRAAKTPKIDPDAIVVAWQAGACEIDGISYSVAEGEHRRGTDPFVQAHGWLFVQDGATIEAEQRNAFSGVVERADRERAAVEHEIQLSGHVPQALEAEDTIRLVRSVTCRAGYVANMEVVTF